MDGQIRLFQKKMMSGQLDEERQKLQQGLKDKIRNAKQEHSEQLEETRQRRARESAHKIDKERERIEQKNRTDSNQTVSSLVYSELFLKIKYLGKY